MRKLIWRNLAAHKLRLFLTVLSVVLGTAFIAGSSMLTASIEKSFTDIVSSSYSQIDVVASSEEGIPMSDIDALRADPRVDAVELSAGNSSAVIAGPDGKPIQTGGAPSQAMAQAPDGKSIGDIAQLVDGQWPLTRGQAALNRTAAEQGTIKVGDQVTMVTARGRETFALSGIYDTDMAVGGFAGLVIPEEQYLEKFAPDGTVASASIGLKDHATAGEVRDALAKEHPGWTLQTGTEKANDETKAIKDQLAFLNYFLWAFGAISLLVGSFIISNTFSMIIAQRLREFALLRGIGASRGQITGSVLAEAAVVGAIGSVLGIFAGIGLSRGIIAVMNAQGVGLPDAGLAVNTTAIVLPLVVGVVVTLFAAWAPARRAARIHPVQAMRSGDSSSSNSLVVRTIVGLVLIGAGVVAAAVAALNADIGTSKERAITVGVGALAVVLGVWFAGPAMSIPFVGSIGRVVGWPFGAVGKLAATNSRRNPRRTAATSFALMLGLMLVASIGMMGASMRDQVNELVDKTFTADYMVTAPQDMGMSLPQDVPERIGEVEGVDHTVSLLLAPVSVLTPPDPSSPMTDMGGVIDGRVREAVNVSLPDGSDDLTGREGVLLSKSKAVDHPVGSTVPVWNFAGRSVDVPVVGVYEDNQTIGPYVLSKQSALELVSENDLQLLNLMVYTNGDTSPAMRSALEDAVADDLVVQVLDREDLKGQIGKQISTILNVLYALLALAVIIAILGIINTLALSVSERRAEIGMLRAVGFQRGQITRMIHLEAIVIALYGAVLGSLIGLGMGWAFIKTLADTGLGHVTVPWLQVGLTVLAAGVVGLIAALWPARSAAKTRPLEAIAEL